MSKIPIKPIVEGLKKHAPKAGKFIKDNRKEIIAGLGALGVVDKLKNRIENNEERTKTEEKKIHPRKKRYNQYKYHLLPELDSKNRNELFNSILEIEDIIDQIKNEEKEELGIKKPLHEKRIKDWNDILTQVKSTLSRKDYLEFLKIYNNPNHQSDYFIGFERDVEQFKKINNAEKHDDLLKYIAEKTGRDTNQIRIDFT